MVSIIAAAAALALLVAPDAPSFNPYAGPKPIAVLMYSSVWFPNVLEMPAVVILDDVTVLITTNGVEGPEFRRRDLSAEEYIYVHDLVRRIVELGNIEPKYNVCPNVTDRAEALLYASDGQRQLATRVYGLAPSAPASCEAGHDGGFGGGISKRLNPPEEVLELHRWLESTSASQSKIWTPAYAEAIFWNAPKASEADIDWPTNWPGPTSDRAVLRNEGFSIFLDGDMLLQARKVLKGRWLLGAVRVNDKSMNAVCRPVYPHELQWRHAFEEANEAAKAKGNAGTTVSLRDLRTSHIPSKDSPPQDR
jgi:hypothetical protein